MRKALLWVSTALFFLIAPVAFAQTTLVNPVTTDGIAGVSYSSMLIAIRFAGALWASVGLAYFISGLIDYMLSHENAHHKKEAQVKISKGMVIFAYFFATWAIIRLILHFIF